MVSSESTRGLPIVVENFPCLHLYAAVRSRTVPVTWPLMWSMHLEHNEEYVSGSLMGHDCPYSVNRLQISKARTRHQMGLGYVLAD